MIRRRREETSRRERTARSTGILCDAKSRARPLRIGVPRLVASPRGSFLVVALVCLVLSAVLIAALLRSTLLLSRQAQVEQQRAQADWLASAGLSRATSRLRSNPDYTGEIWNVPAESLRGSEPARVEIQVRTNERNTSHKAIVVVAEVSPEGALRARRTREAGVYLSLERQ